MSRQSFAYFHVIMDAV
jgi:hypothetical protein